MIAVIAKLIVVIEKYGPVFLQAVITFRNLASELSKKALPKNNPFPAKVIMSKKYFSPHEFKCRCNRPECDAPAMQKDLLDKLNHLRDQWGKPIIINSGSRCAFWNEKIGGVKNSEHLKGNAADLNTSSRQESEKLALLAEKVGFLGIGIYSGFIHVDNGANRRWSGK